MGVVFRVLMLTTYVLCALCGGSPSHVSAEVAAGEAAPAVQTAPETPASVPAPLPAQEPQKTDRLPQKVSLSYCCELARKLNKGIRAAAFEARAARARVLAARGEFDPTLFATGSGGRTDIPVAGIPLTEENISQRNFTAGIRQRLLTGTSIELDASAFYVRDLTGLAVLNPQHETELTLTVTQDLLRDFGIGINRTDISIAENNWGIATEGLRDAMIQNLFEVESAYWELYFAIADLKVREMQLERANKLVQRAEAQVRVGEAAPIEVTRAKASAAAQVTSILSARSDITKLRRRLLRAIGILDSEMADADFELADTPPEGVYKTSFEEAYEAALKHRPDYMQAVFVLENTELTQRFTRNQRLPKLQLFGSAGTAGLADKLDRSIDMAEEGRFNSWEAGLAFEFPIPNRTARGNYQAAQNEHRRARVQVRDLVQRITRDVADALADLGTAEEQIVSAKEAHDLNERLLQLEERSFSLGRSNGVDVLIAQGNAASAERDEVRARTDYATALANLLRVQGTLDQK
jgi:outer membrane protein